MTSMRSSILLGAALIFAACSSTSNNTTDAGNEDAGTHDAGSPDAGPPGNPDGGQILHGDGGSAPAAPQLSFTTDSGGVQLTWTGGASGTLYTLTRSDDAAQFTTVAGASEITATSYSDTTAHALPGQIHAYQVVAIDGNGATPSNIVEVLAAPGNVVAAGSDTTVILLWSAGANASQYDVYKVAADGGGAALLGHAANGEYVDTGAIDAGGSYSYQVIAENADGGQPSTGSNIATTTALGLDVTDQVTHVTDVDAGTVAENGSLRAAALLPDGGGFNEFDSISSSSATVVPGVPAGASYIFSSDFTYFVASSARSLDWSSTTTGRTDAKYPNSLTSQTAIAYDLTGLSAWTVSDAGVGDELVTVSAGAGNELTGVEDHLIDGGIAAAATSFIGLESIDGNAGDWHLVDSTEGDILYMMQLHQETSTTGKAYRSVTNGGSFNNVTMTDGSITALTAALPLLATPTAIADLKIKTSSFLAQKTAVNPSATSAGQDLTIYAQKGFSTYGYYGFPVPLLEAKVDGSATADVDFGAVVYSDPLPASWELFAYATYGFNMSFDLTGDTAPGTFDAVSGFYAPASGFDFAGGVAPTMAPMTNLEIAGKNGFADQVSVGTSPTISWTAPAMSGHIVYFVSLYELSLNDDGSVALGNSTYAPPQYPLQDETFYTTSTSFTIPAGLLTKDDTHSHWYFITVDAQITELNGTAVDQTVTPNRGGTTYMDVEIVSNKFTPGTGVKPPSTYRRPGLPRASPAKQALR